MGLHPLAAHCQHVARTAVALLLPRPDRARPGPDASLLNAFEVGVVDAHEHPLHLAELDREETPDETGDRRFTLSRSEGCRGRRW